MSDPAEFGVATSNSFPSGTGSFSYRGLFRIVVENLAFEKQVAIHAQSGSNWQDINASFVKSLPDNRELWTAPANNSEGQFVAKYTVNGTTFFDNNGGSNYKFPQVFDDFAVLTGNKYPVVLGTATFNGTDLFLNIGVQNLSFSKTVGIVHTTDNWATIGTAFASFGSTMSSGLEAWALTAVVGPAPEVQFAIFYQVSGTEFWDNNFGQNYRVSPSNPQGWGGPPLN